MGCRSMYGLSNSVDVEVQFYQVACANMYGQDHSLLKVRTALCPDLGPHSPQELDHPWSEMR